jgi:hypothetical protein
MLSILEFIDADDTKLSAFLKGGLIGGIKRNQDVANRTFKRVLGGGALLGTALIARKKLRKKKEETK